MTGGGVTILARDANPTAIVVDDSGRQVRPVTGVTRPTSFWSPANPDRP